MRLSIHQPAYLPWLGYFDKIARSDVFVFLDTVQFEKNSFINRNKINSPTGPIWLTIPVQHKDHLQQTLLETRISQQENWQKKHLRSIAQNYQKARNFKTLFPGIEALYATEDLFLADFCFRGLEFWLAELGLATKVMRARDLDVAGKKSELVFNICQKLGATTYISGIHGREYLELDKFASASIVVEFQDFQHPVYPQNFPGFVERLGVVDYLMVR